MALFTTSESPAITVKEVDLTSGVPNVQSTTGAYVGNFSWGPADTPVLVSDERGLVSTFGAPRSSDSSAVNDGAAIDFMSAAYYLQYSNSLQVVRASNSTMKSAHGQTASSPGAVLVKNQDDFENQKSTLDTSNYIWVSKYPGALGNSLEVQFLQDSANFANWTYAKNFPGKMGTSTFAAARGASHDEFHLAVIDKGGDISGTANTLLETFPYLSKASNHKNADGSTNFAPEVINRKSRYINMAGFGASAFPANAGNAAENAVDFRDASYLTVDSAVFAAGVNSGALGVTDIDGAYDTLFNDTDATEVDFLIAPSMKSRADQKTLVNSMIALAEGTRKDCVVVASPSRDDVIDKTPSTANADVITAMDDITFSSYAVLDNNFIKVYDKYNDKYIHIPASSSTAGIMAASDANTAPWFSPAGPRRGRYLGITGLSYSPDKAQRDALYKAGVNPIANIPGQGVLLYGDKTHMTRVSAFDRINVRRLFLVLERAISRAAVNTLFEFNDEFTRAEFVNIVEPVLRNVKGRRGITDFKVVCDETNNTADVVDRNEFIASVFIKPARSINYITLNFVGVRSGVDFEEVVGTV